MIVTLTPNPSLDRTLHLPGLVRNAVNRVERTLTEPSGKGVNVSVALRRCGHPTCAVLPVGGAAGVELAVLLDAAGIDHRDIRMDAAVRSNVSLVEADGTTTKINEAGPRLEQETVRALLAAALATAQPGDWLAVCGSWPDGFGADAVRELLAGARAKNVHTALDTSGAGLRSILEDDDVGSAVPDVVKPNSHELAELTGVALRTIGDVITAGRRLLERGLVTVLVSLGGDGALLLERDGPALWGRARVARVANTAGAGDAFLAGYLLAADLDAPAVDRLACALRFGGSAVRTGGTLFEAVDADLVVKIGTPNPARPLTEPADP